MIKIDNHAEMLSKFLNTKVDEDTKSVEKAYKNFITNRVCSRNLEARIF